MTKDLIERLRGPVQWGYMCLADGGFIADDTPLEAADRLAALQPQSPSLMGSVEGVRDEALEEAAIKRRHVVRNILYETMPSHIHADILRGVADKILAAFSPTIAPPDPVAEYMADYVASHPLTAMKAALSSSPPVGFDPSRIKRPGSAARLAEFEKAVFSLPWIADRLMGGQQFNAYERASNDEDMEDDERKYRLCIGPITDARLICDIEGKDQAELVEAALKVATEALRERMARDEE